MGFGVWVCIVCGKGDAGLGVGAWVELGNEIELKTCSPAAEGICAVIGPN